jgi:hypothetical protein
MGNVKKAFESDNWKKIEEDYSQFKLTIENDEKKSLETLELESQSRYPSQFRGRSSLTNILLSSIPNKVTRRQSAKQFWNRLSITIEPEDETLIMESRDIIFYIQTEKCELVVYPSYDQIEKLKMFLE